ncbi:MAG TPA: rhomboid family intramembrane serine protease [Kofleriaceae bacterium]|nr:rhomboid family intramembrane serine protease [Kofleriaceae bacterium]
MSAGRRLSASLRITRGAMLIAFLEIGVSLVWMMSNTESRRLLSDWLVATPHNVWREGKVWTLFTTALIEQRFLSLLLQMFVLWSFVPTLERFWGTPRFLRFAVTSSVVGAAAGTLCGLVLGQDVPIVGLDPFIYSSIVAFGIIYRRQPVQFFGVLPLTGRQLMIGILGFASLFVLLQRLWPLGAAFAGAILTTVLLLSKRWGPGILWKRWRLARMRRHLKVVRDEPEKWLN